MFDSIIYIRNKWFWFWRGRTPHLHDSRVRQIVTQVEDWHKHRNDPNSSSKYPFMCTARPNHSVMSFRSSLYKVNNKRNQIDLNALRDIIELDEKNQTVRVEPLVNMGQLSRFLIPLGWTLQVLPEMDDLTVGGLIMGFGIESSSHKYGLFQHSCVE